MSYDGIRLAKAPKDPKAALNSCIRHTELPLGSLATVLIPSPLHYSYLTPIYPPPSSPRQIQYVPPSVSIWCHTDILSDLLICLFTLSCLSHTHCLTEEKKKQPPTSPIFQKVTGDDTETGQFSGSLGFQERWEWEENKRR